MSKAINNVIVAGIIAQINDREKFVGAKVSVDTGRKNRDNKPVIYRLDVIASGPIADRLRKCAEGDGILVEGRLSTSRKEGKDTTYTINAAAITRMDAGNFNHAVLSGRLTADPDVRHTSTDKMVTGFTIASDYNYKSGDDWKTLTSFIPVTFWGEVDGTLQKGSLVWVTGELSPRSYEDKNGTRHYLTEINADAVIPGGTGKFGASGNTGKAAATDDGFMPVDDEEDEELPW